MADFIKQGYIEFKTLSPVYIGSGAVAGKKEYLFDQTDDVIEILQMDKLFGHICELGLEQKFERYLLGQPDGQTGIPARELYHFLRDNRIQKSEYRKWTQEIVCIADKGMQTHSVKDINLFVRNARGLPYVPGSGFKGMLRTVLEADYYLCRPEAARKMGENIEDALREHAISPQRRDRLLKDEDLAIDVESLHVPLFDPQKETDSQVKNLRDQRNDILRGLVVGDSEPLSWDDMCVCQKIDLNVAGEEKPLNVLREAIRPGVTIRIPLSIDTKICPYTTKDILLAIKHFYDRYRTQFSEKGKFRVVPKINGNSTTFFLGGGTGYVSKTVTYAIFQGDKAVQNASRMIDGTLGRDARQKHAHYKDVDKGVSPHMLKCTRYNGKLLQMGACYVTKYL